MFTIDCRRNFLAGARGEIRKAGCVGQPEGGDLANAGEDWKLNKRRERTILEIIPICACVINGNIKILRI